MGTAPPKFPDCFALNARTGERTAPDPQFLEVARVFIWSDCCQTAAIPLPGSPTTQMSRHNILCWGRESRVRENGASRNIVVIIGVRLLTIYFNKLRSFVPQESPVNTRLFRQMQESGRTQDFVSTPCPPLSHRSSTGCWQSARRTGATVAHRQIAIFKPLESRMSASTIQVPCDAGEVPVVSQHDY